jgi:carbamoyl-phosphate synthase large subunit
VRVLVLPSVTELGREVIRSLDTHVEIIAGGWPREIDLHQFDHIYPCHDDTLATLAGRFDLISSPVETIRICRHKSRTYDALGSVVRVPHGGYPREFPCFVKPDSGEGSKHSRLVNDETELRLAVREAKSYKGDAIVSEYLPGDEYTVDCFSDRDDGLLWVHPRKRITTERGISTETQTVDGEEFRTFAEGISSTLRLFGAWFFQVKRDKHGYLCLLEVAPRIAGGSSLARLAGVNLPLMTLREHRRDKRYDLPEIKPGTTMKRKEMEPELCKL